MVAVHGGSDCVYWWGRGKGVSSMSRSRLPHCPIVFVLSLRGRSGCWAYFGASVPPPPPPHASHVVWKQEPHIERAHVDVERGRGGGQRETVEDEPADVILTEL